MKVGEEEWELCNLEPCQATARDTTRDSVTWTSVKLEEVDKTPTNEAGRMLETLEKVRQFL